MQKPTKKNKTNHFFLTKFFFLCIMMGGQTITGEIEEKIMWYKMKEQ